jgi:hypothetical protein
MIILNILLRYYKDMFQRIWMFSPSIKLDPQYAPLRKYLEKLTDQQKEPTMLEDLNQAVLGKLLDEQRTITEECRKRKIKPPQVCVILDDLADRGDILTKRQGGNQGSWMVSLATRGRHFGVTWIISSQVLNLIGTVIRKNCRCMCVWRLRNHKEVETLCEEIRVSTTPRPSWQSTITPLQNRFLSFSCAWTRRLVVTCSLQDDSTT